MEGAPSLPALMHVLWFLACQHSYVMSLPSSRLVSRWPKFSLKNKKAAAGPARIPQPPACFCSGFLNKLACGDAAG